MACFTRVVAPIDRCRWWCFFCGGGDDRYRHRIWRRSPDGRVTDIAPWRIGFWREDGFVRDRARTMYWVQCPARRCSNYGRAATDPATFGRATPDRFAHQINWMTASGTEAGVRYVVDGSVLRRLDSAGCMTTLAQDVGTHLMGLWPTASDVYVATHGTRSVVRVRIADGRVTTVACTPAPWAPSSVLVAPDGNLWVLEYSTSSAARVRRIAPGGKSRVF